MRKRILSIIVLLIIPTFAHSQNFGTLSGTFRLGGGNYGTSYSFTTPMIIVALQLLNAVGVNTGFDLRKWSKEEHSFFRFIKIGGDFIIHDWSMSSPTIDIELKRPIEDYQTNLLNSGQYSNYIGYCLNWRSHFTRWGAFIGLDIEWRSFVIFYPYPFNSYHNIRSYVPFAGLRYRLISPTQEIDGFPFNLVSEAGISYVLNTSYHNSDGYGKDALNNGFRLMFGIAITTNRFGSIHLRWSKDMYNLFNNDYEATKGPLLNNEIYNKFSRISVGWSIFM